MEGDEDLNCEPDGFMGAVLAAQSVRGVKAMINGPGGCRSRALNLLREMMLEYTGEEDRCCSSKYMSRVGMLPCTYLNADDIILGSGTKITDGLKNVISDTGSDVVLIDTLGATIQVVDRELAVAGSGFAEKTVLADENLSGMTFAEGFDDTVRRLVSRFAERSDSPQKGIVNVLGYTQADRSWDYGREEISELLSLLGLEVGCFVGCGCTKEELKESGSSCLNIVIHPEYCINTAEFYKRELGIPYILPSSGTPLGYDSIRTFLTDIAHYLSIGCEHALSVVDREEQKTFRVLRNYDKFANGLRCTSMSLNGLESDLKPIAKLAVDYFNIAPRAVNIRGTNSAYVSGPLRGYLEDIGYPGSLGRNGYVPNMSMYFGDGLSADSFGEKHPEVNCIGIMMPYPDTVPLADRCLVGFSGTRNLLDMMMNGMKKFTCGQPTPADYR